MRPTVPCDAAERRRCCEVETKSWLSHARAALGLLVDLDEAQVVLGELLGRRLALEVAVQEGLQRVPPDRAPDREADEAGHRRGLLEPVVDLLGARAAPEQHADHAVAAAAPRGLGE